MQLTKQHREALLEELTQAKIKLEQSQSFLNLMFEQKEENALPYAEIQCFLAGERIKLIEKSLIDNEIDF